MKCALFVLLLALSACRSPSEMPPKTDALAPQPIATARSWSHAPAAAAQPAGMPMPAAPPVPRDPSTKARDQSGELARNSVVNGRLPDVGQRAAFPFFAEQGEQSLFELAAYGYERGASGRVRFSIEDESGAELFRDEQDASVVWREFFSFVAPKAGNFKFSLEILAGGYRFVLVRHSDYPPLDAQPIEFGARELVHAHLPNAAATATFHIPARAGEELALKLSATREEARAEARRGALSIDAMALRLRSMSEPSMAAASEGATTGEMDMGMSMEGPGRARRAGVPATQYQSFLLEVFQDGARLGPACSYMRLRSANSGLLEVRVRAGNSGGGGLFDLEVERDLQLVRVHGVVVDNEDRLLSGVQVHFLREPDGDLVAVAQSDARGAFESSLVPARLAIQMMRGDRTARDSVRVELSEATELNLVFVPGARRR